MNFAFIKNGKVANVAVADQAFIDQLLQTDYGKTYDAIVEASDDAQIGWGYSAGVFIDPTPITHPDPPADATDIPVVPTEGGES